ncbi:oxygenase MpaB family protein [Streptomyces roseolus]|uniref:oxygenase MpaB family protein n=1 Tax=Streptomyces roseolus TaxID=67358 RepID=UPI003649CA10
MPAHPGGHRQQEAGGEGQVGRGPAAFSAHSGFQGAPQRTGTFLAVTTFGTSGDAERAVPRGRRVHERVAAHDPNIAYVPYGPRGRACRG